MEVQASSAAVDGTGVMTAASIMQQWGRVALLMAMAAVLIVQRQRHQLRQHKQLSHEH
jgi:hypothetical protein